MSYTASGRAVKEQKSPPPPPHRQKGKVALFCAGIFKQSMGAKNRVGICRVALPARLATKAGGIDSLESILVFLKSLKIRALIGHFSCM